LRPPPGGRKLPVVIRRRLLTTPPGADYSIRVLGDRRKLLRDFYHALLRGPWWVTIASISGVFLAANALFALGYVATGGIVHAAPGSFRDAFFFSVQTMGTIGYGALYPESPLANTLVVAECITGLTLTALATGLVFAKFSRSTARVAFTHEAVIAPMDGVPTLMFRLGNQRGNQIVDAQIRAVLVRTERTAEGVAFYRTLDLALTRGHAMSLSRSWSVMHRIDAHSPLAGRTPESFAAEETEIGVMVIGLDDITMQPVHAGYRYFARDVLWGARHADILSESADGNLVLDLAKFHDVVPSAPLPAFPYPRPDAPALPGAGRPIESQRRR
jgi:inward rectifier potassium channel